MSSESPSPESFDLGDLSDLADGESRSFDDVGRFGVMVCRVDGDLYAIENNCSHADTPLSEGRLQGHTVICPLHGAQFDVRDGSHAGPPAWTGVDCYAVQEGEQGVRVTIAAPDQGDSQGGYGEAGARFRTR